MSSERPAADAALRFNPTPFHPHHEAGILLQFREHGFAVADGVFERDSVDEFVEQIKATMVPRTDTPHYAYAMPDSSPVCIAPVMGPRLRQLLRGAFTSWIAPAEPALMQSEWLISPSGLDESSVIGWHKDADFRCTSSVEGYVPPSVIHVGTYFSDVTPEHGPTYVIPRSHRDPHLSPYNGGHERPFLCRKEDMVLWDQRLWHRASTRTAPGLRILALFPFYAVYTPHVTRQLQMQRAQRDAWLRSTDPAERLFLGGMFEPS